LASCGTDKKIKIFDCRSHRLLQHYDAHDDAVNSISFNSAGTHLISSSQDSTIKIWDLRRGCILYTLFGHEGATTAANFSPMGDYFLSGGADSVVLCWESNMNSRRFEDLSEISAKIDTEQFVTQKERVDKLPTTRGTKVGKNKENNNRLSNLDETDILDDSASQAKPEQLPSQKVIGGITYKQLKPEVKQTLDKVVYQLELVAKTL
jgi:centriolar protein POC1